jgi:hypothetical protein
MPHQVEVDDEVFAFVQSHAEPLIDTFNTSLRRLLPLVPAKEGIASPVAIGARSERPVFPGGTPKALKQILEVALLVRGGAYDRTSATHVVADRYRIAVQTVLDKYARQLGLNTQQFDRLLDQTDLKELKRLLQSKFNSHADLIDRTLR